MPYDLNKEDGFRDVKTLDYHLCTEEDWAQFSYIDPEEFDRNHPFEKDKWFCFDDLESLSVNRGWSGSGSGRTLAFEFRPCQ